MKAANFLIPYFINKIKILSQTILNNSRMYIINWSIYVYGNSVRAEMCQDSDKIYKSINDIITTPYRLK